MNIVIKESNKERITSALKVAAGKHTARVCTNYEDLIAHMKEAECVFETRPHDAELIIRVGAGHFPGAYKYRAEGSCIVVKYDSRGVAKLTYASVWDSKGGQAYNWSISANEAARQLSKIGVEVVK